MQGFLLPVIKTTMILIMVLALGINSMAIIKNSEQVYIYNTLRSIIGYFAIYRNSQEKCE